MNKKISSLVLISLFVGELFVFNPVFAQRAKRNTKRASGGTRRAASSIRSAAATNVSTTTTQQEVVEEQPATPAVVEEIAPVVEAVVEQPAPVTETKVVIVKDSVDSELVNNINVLRSEVLKIMDEAKNACVGIASSLSSISSNMSTSTGFSGLGTVVGGADFTADFTKNSSNDAIGKVSNVIDKGSTFMQGAAGVANVGAMISSSTASANTSKVADKMEECNKKVKELNVKKNELAMEIEKANQNPYDDATISKSETIIESCEAFSSADMAALKGLSTTAAVSSAVGTAASIAGVVSNVFVGKDSSNKAADVSAKVSGGVGTGAAALSTTVSAIAVNKAKANLARATKCEKAFSVLY